MNDTPLTRTDDIRRRSRTLPRPRTTAALPILGAHGDRRQLARLTFGKMRIPLTADELAALTRRAERYLLDKGTMFGFVLSLIGGDSVQR